jgi:protocatechuate 3,4-dioxygenase beta subunit
MKNKCIVILLCSWIITACGQTQDAYKDPVLVGGSCEGCEAIFEYGDEALLPVDTLPGFYDQGQKIKISGTIYHQDGKTPAPNVILYVYQTNKNGIYENKNKEDNWAQRHGYIRGWIKTGVDGQYSIYTTMPGTYPNRKEPAHIHPTILEPNGKYYWLHSILFEGDPLIDKNNMKPNASKRGGTGIITLEHDGQLLQGKMDFVLGKNIPGYK